MPQYVRRPALVVAALAALTLAWAGTARAAAPTLLMPGVTYTRTVEFTAHGPVVVHVVEGPRPGGLWSLRPALAHGAVVGRERLTDLEKEASGSATVVGINADHFGSDGHPEGIVQRGGVLDSEPSSGRVSIGIDPAGSLRLDRVQFFATWQGSGQRRPLRVNETPTRNGIALFTPSWGVAAPGFAGSAAAVIASFPALRAGAEPTGTVTAVSRSTPVAIPAGGAVLVARGTAAAQLAAEAPVGQVVTVRIVLEPDWSTVPDAIGGGPRLVRNGRPVFRSDEAFSADELVPRRARAAIGQTAAGRLLLVVADGGLHGYSTGLTNFELAQTLVRHHAVTAAALGWGGDATLAFDGVLLNRPSDPTGERAISDALLLAYEGVYAPQPATAVLSPNGDGLGERQTVAYKLARPSDVVATLTGPDGIARITDAAARGPGLYSFAFTGRKPDGTAEPEGVWQWSVAARDDLGRDSRAVRTFTLNNTLGFLRVSPVFRLGRGRLVARFALTRPAAVTADVESLGGVVVRRFAKRRLAAGPRSLSWNGRVGRRLALYPGDYVVRVVARNRLGRTDLTSRVRARVARR